MKKLPSHEFLLVTVIGLIAATAIPADSTELLENPGFETGECSGNAPPLPWMQEWHPAEAGPALLTSTAARTGSCGLWQFTYNGPDSSFSTTYQQLPASPGQTFQGSAYMRKARVEDGGSWAPGSYASARVSFLDSSGSTLVLHESDHLTDTDAGWMEKSVVAGPAPEGTEFVRFGLFLTKPGSISGQSVANFDDCSLQELIVPSLHLSKRALGFGVYREVLTFGITNSGSGTLTWAITGDVDWISTSDSSGVTSAEVDSVAVFLNRSILPTDSLAVLTRLHVTSDGGDLDIDVYAESLDPYPVPDAPSPTWTEGYLLKQQRRLPDGSLGQPRSYGVRGAAWSPASVGTPDDRLARQQEFAEWYELDIQMLRMMHANAVYTFLDFGTDESAFDVLDYFYYNDVMAIVTVDWDGTYDLNRLETVVSAYKDHPAILMWAIGNEWNINLYHDTFSDVWEAAEATEAAAQLVKSIDATHAVATIYGEIQPDTTEVIVNDICPSVDVWGLNIYRGPSFGDLFDQWRATTIKPMFISEYGTDSFFSTGWDPEDLDPVWGYIDESMQAEFERGLWLEIFSNLSGLFPPSVCAGGTVFEWNDEWWKTGDPYVHEPLGYYTWWNESAFPDAFGNEEYFGIVNIDRTTKEAYRMFRDEYRRVATAVDPPEDADEGVVDFSIEYGSAGSSFLTQDPVEVYLTLPSDSHVTARVLDVRGRLIRALVEGELTEGRHSIPWDGTDDGGEDVAKGVYFFQARVNGESKALKLVVVE